MADNRRLKTELESVAQQLDDLIANPLVEIETQFVDVPDRAIEKAWLTSQIKLLRRHGKGIRDLMAEQRRIVKLLMSGDPDGTLDTHEGGV
jgi:hypothetical protein